MLQYLKILKFLWVVFWFHIHISILADHQQICVLFFFIKYRKLLMNYLPFTILIEMTDRSEETLHLFCRMHSFSCFFSENSATVMEIDHDMHQVYTETMQVSQALQSNLHCIWNKNSSQYNILDYSYLIVVASICFCIIYSLRSEICRTFRIQVGCTHARTIKNHHNAFLWSLQKATLKVGSQKIGRIFFPILCTGRSEKHEFWVDFSPLE